MMADQSLCPVHFSEIQTFLGQAGVERPVTAIQKQPDVENDKGQKCLGHGNALAAAVKRGEVVYVVDDDGCAHLNAGWNLREALLEAGWEGCVEGIFRAGTRQSATGELSWAPFRSTTIETPIRLPARFQAANDAEEAPPEVPAEEPELAPVIPLNTPQQ